MSRRQIQRATRCAPIPNASATASISTAVSLKMIRPAPIAGASAMAVIKSSGSEAGLKAARSVQDAAARSQARGRASTFGLYAITPNDAQRAALPVEVVR